MLHSRWLGMSRDSGLSIGHAEGCSCTKLTFVMPSQACDFVDMFCAREIYSTSTIDITTISTRASLAGSHSSAGTKKPLTARPSSSSSYPRVVVDHVCCALSLSITSASTTCPTDTRSTRCCPPEAVLGCHLTHPAYMQLLQLRLVLSDSGQPCS